MLSNFYIAAIETFLLTMEASQVVFMRMERFALGGSDALEEAELMISEKVTVFSQASFDLLAGASHSFICDNLRAAVQINDLRLTALRLPQQRAA